MLPSSKLALLAAVLALAGTTNSTRTQKLHAKHQERALVSTAAGKACKSLSTLVYTSYAPSPNYLLEIQHASSNAADIPTCVVEPETPEQVGQILKVVGQYRAPFAVQSGGHTSNPGFSSTKGVHITLSRFNHVTLSSDGLTADVGSGQSWGDVYKKLEGTGRIVVGGRVSSVGVGGFLAYGGGYSFHSNQYGLGVDLVEEYTLVLPDGTVKSVTSTSDNKLFNALKGSGNNFGIITSFKLKTVPMPSQIWGGQIVYSEDKFSQLSSIIASFSSNNLDPKAAILPSFTAVLADAISLLVVQIFYDGPSPPPGTFDAFTSVQSVSKDLKARTFVDFIEATPAGAVNGLRTYFHPIPVKGYTPKLVKAFADMASEYALKGTLQTGAVIAASVEPFTAGAFAASSGLEAFPHDQDHACFPSLIGVNWISPLSDGYWQKAAERIVARLTATAIKEGQDLSGCPYYPNYSLYNTPLEKIYLDNLPALKAYKAEIDPKNVMGLAGGFKL